LFLFDSYVKIYPIMDMVKYSLLFLVLSVTTTYAQIGPDGTGTVNGYYIGPGADLSLAGLDNADLTNARLINADLTMARLINADLSFANLSGANLTNATLGNADLSGADLSGADLRYADLSGADLRYADLRYADLRYADLRNADLSGANLSNAKVNQDENNVGAYVYYPNNFPGAIFTNVISQSDYDAVVAERDARPTQAAYNAVEAERDAALEAQATAEAERDARPTQAAYDAVVAERDAKLTLDEVKDLRAGSTMIAVEDGQATLSMDIEKSLDLSNWTFDRTTTVDIPIEDGVGTQFFRFKMTE
jgi:uncharacterized protein YjbI with pentapeptide repeats